MTTTYRATPITTSIHLDGDNPIFGESGGAFIVLKQYNDQNEPGELRFDLKELELIARVAKEMVAEYNKVLKPIAPGHK